jgi:hypothetical protein
MRYVGLLGLLVLTGCGVVPPKDASCYVQTFTRRQDDTLPLAMVAASGGNPCTFSAYLAYGDGPVPLNGGSVLVQPANGTARTVEGSGGTLVEYVPHDGFTGSDQFTVALGQPAQLGLTVNVSVRAPVSPLGPVATLALGTPEAPFRVPVSQPTPEPGDHTYR